MRARWPFVLASLRSRVRRGTWKRGCGAGARVEQGSNSFWLSRGGWGCSLMLRSSFSISQRRGGGGYRRRSRITCIGGNSEDTRKKLLRVEQHFGLGLGHCPFGYFDEESGKTHAAFGGTRFALFVQFAGEVANFDPLRPVLSVKTRTRHVKGLFVNEFAEAADDFDDVLAGFFVGWDAAETVDSAGAGVIGGDG